MLFDLCIVESMSVMLQILFVACLISWELRQRKEASYESATSLLQVSPRAEGPDKKHEALAAALTERDAARQMCQGVRAMLAQSEALRKADPDTKVLLDAGQDYTSH